MLQTKKTFAVLLTLGLLAFSFCAIAQTDDDDDYDPKEPNYKHSIRLSLSSPHTWKLLNPAVNTAITFDKRKNFFLFGLDLMIPTTRENLPEVDRYTGWGIQFSYGRYMSRKNIQQGLYLIYNFRYQSIDDAWSAEGYFGGPDLIRLERKLWFESYESNFGAGLKSFMTQYFYFDIMAGAGFTINVDYGNSIHSFTNPAILVRGGIGYAIK